MSTAGRSVASQQQNNWSHIARYAKQLEEQDKTRRKEGTKQMRTHMRAELDQQMAERRHREEEHKLDELSHFKAQQGEWEQWADMEKDRDEQRREKAARMKKEREEQVLLN